MTVHVGTSGWQYRDWRAAFYPHSLEQRAWLGHYAGRFATVEVNATFYRLPPPETFARWARATPSDFVFSVKVSRYLTHVRRLREPHEPVERLLAASAPLGARRGPFLLQLPPTLRADPARLGATLAAFPPGVRVAVEFRHPSWWSEEVHRLLAAHGAAAVLADRGSRLVTPAWRTAGWAFVRLHAGRGSPPPCYGRRVLDQRARLIAGLWGPGAEAFVYFNNDTHCCAVRDARRFAARAAARGLAPTRVPGAREVTLA